MRGAIITCLAERAKWDAGLVPHSLSQLGVRKMMAPPVDVVGPRPKLGDVEAPPRSRSSLSSMAEVESEPLGRARRRPSAEARAESEPWGRAKRSSSSSGAEPESEPWVGRSGVRRLPGLSQSPSPGSGGAEFAVFRG
jgi:hypothetical protein